MEYAYVNGKILPAKNAVISIFDRGIVLGDGLFETLKAVEGVPEFFGEHYQRLHNSSKKIKIRLPLSEWELGTIIANLCRKSHLSHAVVRVTLTRGRYMGKLSINPEVPPSLIVSVRPLLPEPDWAYTKGVSIAVSDISKAAASGLDPTVKSTNYLANIFAAAQAEKKKCYEAILLGKKGEIAELSTSSFFCVIRGKVRTPPIDTGILPGITRQITLAIMKRSHLPFLEKSVFLKNIPNMSEAFLTSSIRGIVPIIQIDGSAVGNGKPGPITRNIRMLYSLHCLKSREKIKKSGKAGVGVVP